MKRGTYSTLARRTKKLRQQSLSCNFTTNPSHAVVEPIVAASIPLATPSSSLQPEPTSLAPSPSETVQNNHEQDPDDRDQHEESHDDEEHLEGDASVPIASDEGPHASLSNPSNIGQQKILIGIDMSIKDFVPRKPVFAKMKEIVHGHFDGPWTSITKVPANAKTLWFEEFEKCFCWNISTAAMKKIFFFQAGKSLSNTFKPHFISGTTPYFVKEDIWQKMLTLKRTDPRMVNQSKANKKNRRSKRAIDKGPYRGGSRKVKKWIQVMEKEKGSRQKISKVVRTLWSKNKTGEEIAPETLSYVTEFDRLHDEISSSEPISKDKEMELWLKATNGVHNNRVFGFGEEGAGLVRSGLVANLNGDPGSSTSYMHTQDLIEPFKEEIREVRDEMKNLKDMLEKVLQHVQGGSSPSA